jgi:3-hydroxyisobutyrate dehydrogenase-like beta-hydroxyacid dehydrogenase
MENRNIGIIGLGRVGIPVARAFLKSGYTAFGYDSRNEAANEFTALGGLHLSSPSEVARHCQTIIVLVLNDIQVLEVILGYNGLLEGADKKLSTIICMSTINRSNLESIAIQCEEKNIGFVDCPFTGGPSRVPSGELTLIAAASPEQIKKVNPLLNVIGKVVHVGNTPGLGQAVKHCNQLFVGVVHGATMEVITMARKLNLDTAVVSKIIGRGIAGNDYFRLLSESVLNGMPSPGGLGQMCKDVSIVSKTLDEVHMPAHIFRAAAAYFQLAEDWGMQQREGADLIEVVERVSEKDDDGQLKRK